MSPCRTGLQSCGEACAELAKLGTQNTFELEALRWKHHQVLC